MNNGRMVSIWEGTLCRIRRVRRDFCSHKQLKTVSISLLNSLRGSLSLWSSGTKTQKVTRLRTVRRTGPRPCTIPSSMERRRRWRRSQLEREHSPQAACPRPGWQSAIARRPTPLGVGSKQTPKAERGSRKHLSPQALPRSLKPRSLPGSMSKPRKPTLNLPPQNRPRRRSHENLLGLY